PGSLWPQEIATAAAAAGAAGRGTLIVVPDARDLSLIDGALARVLGPGRHACLSAGLGPAERYRRWLSVARGTVRVVGGTRAARSARMPSLALRMARAGLAHGPVLVQVPRRGYVTAVACENCRAPARCPACAGPLALEGDGGPARCRWCGRADPGWRCPACGDPRLRALVTGAGRTAEELGRAFPGTPVVVSGGATVVGLVPRAPALV